MDSTDTIAAIATPPGQGGIGIVRVSGPAAGAIATAVLGRVPPPRQAYFGGFMGQADAAGGDVLLIDRGLALFFAGPKSFTGEDTLELHGHGGPVVLQRLLERVILAGARMAQPGEFSQRAFLNDKLDLAQAEAIADLISAGSAQAARAAMRSLEGAFSQQVNELSARLIALRTHVEAAIDFADEEIDFLSDASLTEGLRAALSTLDALGATARRGRLLRDGMTVVIAGPPNAGKSSLLNQLAGIDAAIVTDIPGTTRDVLREYIHIDGMPLHVVDTAGLRRSEDKVEQAGIERARAEIARADRILLVEAAGAEADVGLAADRATRAADPDPTIAEILAHADVPVTRIRNKIDLSGETAGFMHEPGQTGIRLCALSGDGVDLLRAHLKEVMGFAGQDATAVTARARHVSALRETRTHVERALAQLEQAQAGELAAEELRIAHRALGAITGDFTTEDLLGEIFSSFCIGK